MMPSVKTPSSSLPASPRVGYKPLNLDKVFNNLSNGTAASQIQTRCNENAKSGIHLSHDLAQLHSLGAELRHGLLQAVEALRLVQSNDETMRASIESASFQTEKSITELNKVISSVKDDSTRLKAKFESLDASQKQMQSRLAELEKVNKAKKGANYNSPSGVKLRQTFVQFLTSELHFCRNIAKLCHRKPNESLASVLPASLFQVYEVHSDFQTQLENRMAKWGHWGCIGDVFLRLLDQKTSHFCDIYRIYANELLAIFGAGESPVCAPLLLPFRRLADYVAFLEANQKVLDPDHPDLYNVTKSIEKLRTLILKLNENQLRYLLVEENVTPVGNGTSFQNQNQDQAGTMARSRYHKASDASARRKSAFSQNSMLKSRSHGDIHHAVQNDTSYLAKTNNLGSDGATDDDDDGDVDLNSPELHLESRSLPRSKLKNQVMFSCKTFEDDVVLDCWTSKPDKPATSRSGSVEMLSDFHQTGSTCVPPVPHKSCDSTLTARHQFVRGDHRLYLGNGHSTIGSSSGSSSGSGGSTSGKSANPVSSYQPLESVKQSLLNLFNGYKKKKRSALRSNGFMGAPGQRAVNTPQIRILSPPSSSMTSTSGSMLTSTNLHVDVRDTCSALSSLRGSSDEERSLGTHLVPSSPMSSNAVAAIPAS